MVWQAWIQPDDTAVLENVSFWKLINQVVDHLRKDMIIRSRVGFV